MRSTSFQIPSYIVTQERQYIIPTIFTFYLVIFSLSTPVANARKMESTSVYITYATDYKFRGNNINVGLFNSTLEVSTFGWTTSFNYQNLAGDENLLEFSFSYSYPIGFADVTAGIDYFELPSAYGLPDANEFFIQLYGNPVWNGTLPYGIIPSIKQSFRVNDSSANFTEIKLEKEVVFSKHNLLFNPYFEIGAGKYFTNQWDLNHLELGADLTWQATDKFYISPYYSFTKPLKALKESTGESGSDSQYGLMLRYQF